MSKQELTPWFPAGRKPSRRGVYETKSCRAQDFETFQYWDGEYWSYFNPNAAEAYDARTQISSVQRPYWRGLTSPGKKS